ncbi:hypothetical protein BDV98DRAFT_578033 [Pterulicium gracile]|uniref:Lysine-specific metallo-endopeptidase domain-containing protein n=1 Tax=Pterulicium gracile TaxID=1884261 RepID=A0A5C3PZG9_9AGAR|nr:hypothetical protein BDV98DRAFT_578033 [Pterula gracilis]
MIAGDLASSGTRQIYCNRDTAGLCGPQSGVIAYAIIVTSGGNIVGSDIFTCDSFFNNYRPTAQAICPSSVDNLPWSQGGIMLHELSHATAGTTDVAYGCNTNRNLQHNDKFRNADNYQCLALHNFRLHNC